MNQHNNIEPGLGDDAGPATVATAVPLAAAPRRRRRLWPWLLLTAAVLLLLVAAATAALVVSLFQQLPQVWPVAVQGQDVLRHMSDALTRLAQALQQFWPWLGSVDWHWQLDELTVGGLTLGLVALVAGLVMAVLGLMTLLPILVLAVLAGVVVAVLATVLLAGAVAALALSPLWLPALGIWWWLRRKTARAVAPAAA